MAADNLTIAVLASCGNEWISKKKCEFPFMQNQVGYSLNPLIKKPGIMESMRVLLIHQTPDYFKRLEKTSAANYVKKMNCPISCICLQIPTAFFSLKWNFSAKNMSNTLRSSPGLAGIKKSSGHSTDMPSGDIRDYALSHTPVDIKVCAMTEEWSGLKLMVRKATRKKHN